MILIPYVTTVGLWPSYGWNCYRFSFNKLAGELVFLPTYPPEHGDNRHVILAHQSECEHAFLANNLVDNLAKVSDT
jgi:hypothetical protein